jgi:hypothetical protein
MPKSVDSKIVPLNELFQTTFAVDFYQREYVWTKKQISDLMTDLQTEFSRNYHAGDPASVVPRYEPYYMGEVVLAKTGTEGSLSIVDGQQRITSLTLLLIYLCHRCQIQGQSDYALVVATLSNLVYSNYYGQRKFKIDIPERAACLLGLLENGSYTPAPSDGPSVQNIVDRYSDIEELWDSELDQALPNFSYWLIYKILFSKVVADSESFAYVIFETMNDRGLSLTQIEMLRSYLLANVPHSCRDEAIARFSKIEKRLKDIHAKAAPDFFKVFLRGHYADDLSQKDSGTDFNRIGNEFHRWVRDNASRLGLTDPQGYMNFVDRLDYYSGVYSAINGLIRGRDTHKNLYVIVNDDYKFTLQPAVLLAAVSYCEQESTISEKFALLSKFLSHVLSWRVWNQRTIAQSSMEAPIYALCKKIREKSLSEIPVLLQEWESVDFPEIVPKLATPPVLNQQNRAKTRVLLSLITEIVARESGEPGYVLGTNEQIEVEHIWADHFDQHGDEFASEQDFALARNGIGDLLVLPKSFNASYGDLPYAEKRTQYFSQNILAQTLCPEKYANNPGFAAFLNRSGLSFKPYDSFTKESIQERAELYRQILLWNWRGN